MWEGKDGNHGSAPSGVENKCGNNVRTWHDAQEAGLGSHSCPHADVFVPTRRRLRENAIGPVGVPGRGQSAAQASP